MALKFLVLLAAVLGQLTVLGHQARAQDSPTQLSGFTEPEIFAIQDGEPLVCDDQNLIRLMYRAHQHAPQTLQRFSQHNQQIHLSQIAADPRSFRCYLFRFSGVAQTIKRFENPTAETDSLEHHFDLIRFSSDDDDCLVVVPTTGRPQRWPLNQQIDEPVSFSGFFLGNFDFHPDNDSPNAIWMDGLVSTKQPVFVAREIEWYPTSHADSFKINESELLLAKYGVNIARLDWVRSNVLGKINRESAESFYQTLNAVDRIPREEFPQQTIDFKECLQEPVKFQSAPMMLEGQIRRITEIVVDDKSQVESGVDRYFQLDLFVPLNGHKIVFRSPRAASSDAVTSHENRFPITVCVTKLPASKDQLNRQRVVIPCFFFQRWNYISQRSMERSDTPLQDAPLAIGLCPTQVQEPESPLNWWIGIFSVLCVLGLGALYWFFGRTPAVASTSSYSGKPMPDKIDWDDLDVN